MKMFITKLSNILASYQTSYFVVIMIDSLSFYHFI